MLIVKLQMPSNWIRTINNISIYCVLRKYVQLRLPQYKEIIQLVLDRLGPISEWIP